jgi:hypothetical protein
MLEHIPPFAILDSDHDGQTTRTFDSPAFA